MGIPEGSGLQSTADPQAGGESNPKPLWSAHVGPLPPLPPLHPRPFPGPSGQQSCCCQARGRECAGTGVFCFCSLALPGESPRGSVLMNPNPGSLFGAPGNSRTGGRHPGRLRPDGTESWESGAGGAGPSLANSRLLKNVSIRRRFGSGFLYLENGHNNRVLCNFARRQ